MKKPKKIIGMKYRTRILIVFLLTVTIITISGIYINQTMTILMGDTTKMFSKNLELTSTYQKLEDIQSDIENYLSTNSSESLLSFYDNTNTLNNYVSDIEKNITYTPQGIKIKNVANMIKHYLVQAEDTMNAKRGRNVNGYSTGYENTIQESTVIINYIKEIMSDDIINSAEKYISINNQTQSVSTFNNIFIAVIVMYVIIIIVLFSIEITKPITKLSHYAKEISDGNFDVNIRPMKVSGEIAVLYDAFELMKVNIKEYVNEMLKNQQLENSLNEQKLNNLNMQKNLKESELLALQSQVNPHFIFNTINIGAKIAMMQGDNATCTYLENAADIFRYNLKGLDNESTIRDEINNVNSYMFLLQTRFGDAVKYVPDVCVDDEMLDSFVIPRMTLQPIVENAYIHGISGLEDGGTIKLRIKSDEDFLYIYIIDNGVGISQDKIESIINTPDVNISTSKKGHTTGIGIDNVQRRLRLFFGVNDVMKIECVHGETRFILTLPK